MRCFQLLFNRIRYILPLWTAVISKRNSRLEKIVSSNIFSHTMPWSWKVSTVKWCTQLFTHAHWRATATSHPVARRCYIGDLPGPLLSFQTEQFACNYYVFLHLHIYTQPNVIILAWMFKPRMDLLCRFFLASNNGQKSTYQWDVGRWKSTCTCYSDIMWCIAN